MQDGIVLRGKIKNSDSFHRGKSRDPSRFFHDVFRRLLAGIRMTFYQLRIGLVRLWQMFSDICLVRGRTYQTLPISGSTVLFILRRPPKTILVCIGACDSGVTSHFGDGETRCGRVCKTTLLTLQTENAWKNKKRQCNLDLSNRQNPRWFAHIRVLAHSASFSNVPGRWLWMLLYISKSNMKTGHIYWANFRTRLGPSSGKHWENWSI
jgi:hypothetical protein